MSNTWNLLKLASSLIFSDSVKIFFPNVDLLKMSTEIPNVDLLMYVHIQTLQVLYSMSILGSFWL